MTEAATQKKPEIVVVASARIPAGLIGAREPLTLHLSWSSPPGSLRVEKVVVGRRKKRTISDRG